MAYQLVLKRVNEEKKREKIALYIAEMSGAQEQQILNAISTKSISLGKDFSFEKASEVKQKFELMGAEIVLKNLEATAIQQPISDEDEEEGVLLTHEEYVKALNQRSDLFTVEKDKRLSFIMPFALLLGIFTGISLLKLEIVYVPEDFLPGPSKTVNVTLVDPDVIKKDTPKETPKEKIETEKVSIKKTTQPKNTKRSTPKSKGGGDPRQRVLKSGVFASMSKQITAETIANADAFARGGHAKGIDALIAGKKGLKKGGSSNYGKRQEGAGVGFGPGSGSKFGGGHGEGISLKADRGVNPSRHKPLKRKKIGRIKPPKARGAGAAVGSRSKADIMRTVRANLASLKYAYNKRLKANPGMGGKVTVKWAIDEFGNVLHCRIVSSKINDPVFEKEIIRKIKAWSFGRIKIPGDVTEVTYPFVFTK